MALLITVELNPTPLKTGGDGHFEPAVMRGAGVVSLRLGKGHAGSYGFCTVTLVPSPVSFVVASEKGRGGSYGLYKHFGSFPGKSRVLRLGWVD